MMTKTIKSTLLSLVLVLGLVAIIPAPVHAGLFDNAKSTACKGVDPGKTDCSGGESQVDSALKNIVNLLSVIVGIAAVIMIIVGGFRYITSGGDSNNINSAKNTIVYALVGLIIVAMAQVLVRFVLTKV